MSAAAELQAPPRSRLTVRLLSAFQIDIRALAAMRIVLGLTILYDLLERAQFLKIYYTDWGVSPRGLVNSGFIGKVSFYSLSGSFGWAIAVLAAHLVVALMYTIGYRTRWAALVLALFTYSLINRNPTLTNAGDNLELWLLVWSIFLPVAAVASVDARIANFDWRWARVRRVFTIASACILLQMAFVYWSAVTAKRDPAWSSDFSAIYLFLRGHWATPLGWWLGSFAWAMPILTGMTMLLEAIGPVIALLTFSMPRTRTVIALIFIAFHLGLVVTMYVGPFAFICIAGWLLFLPREFWDALSRLLAVRTMTESWRRLIGIATLALRKLGPTRVDGLRLPRATQIALSILLAYLVLINVVLDMPIEIRRLTGTVAHLPNLKQSWPVMHVPYQYFGVLAIEVRLADGTVRELSRDDSAYFNYTLPRGRTQEEYLERLSFPRETAPLVEYRATLVTGSFLAPTPVLAQFCEFHRRVWNELHPNPGDQIVSLTAYCKYRGIVPPDATDRDRQPIGRWALHAWPVEVHAVAERRL